MRGQAKDTPFEQVIEKADMALARGVEAREHARALQNEVRANQDRIRQAKSRHAQLTAAIERSRELLRRSRAAARKKARK